MGDTLELKAGNHAKKSLFARSHPQGRFYAIKKR